MQFNNCYLDTLNRAVEMNFKDEFEKKLKTLLFLGLLRDKLILFAN